MNNKLAFVIFIVVILMLIGWLFPSNKDTDRSHYNVYTCSHCHGSGCAWCNGTGRYAVKNPGY